MKIMKFLSTGLASTLLITAGCGGEDGDTGGNTGLITEETAVQLAVQMMSYKDFQTSLINGKNIGSGTKSSTSQTKVAVQYDCPVSGSYTFDSVTGNWVFTDCNDGYSITNGSTSISTTDTVTSTTSNLTSSFGGILIDIAFTGSVDSSPNGAYDFDIDMSFITSAGSLTIVTDPAFSGTGTNPPTSGTMTISAPGNSKILITAFSSYMEVKADADGDGFYEFTTQVDWATAGY